MTLTPKDSPIGSRWDRRQSLPGGFLQLGPAPTRRPQRDSNHRLLRLLPARWSPPGHPRAPARKREAGEVQGEEDITAGVRAWAHPHPQARSNGHKTDRHWGRSPSASRPTSVLLARGASRAPPRLAHCAGACRREEMDGCEGGRPPTANPRPGPAPSGAGRLALRY